MSKGRRKDHVWRFVKYKGDVSIYAKCSCGFRYGCCKHKDSEGVSMLPDPSKLYPYCPICGSRKTRYYDNVTKVDVYPWE